MKNKYRLWVSIFWAALLVTSCDPRPTPAKSPYLIVLGIAQDAGYPQADCQKDCCRKAWDDPLSRRLASCLGIVNAANDTAWMIECTPDFKEQWFRLQQTAPSGATALGGILLSHAHMGHYSGLLHVGNEAMGARGIPVYAMPRMSTFIQSNQPWRFLLDLGNITLRPLNHGSPVHLGSGIIITPMLVPHRDEFSETVGYLVSGPTSAVLFIPDIDKWHLWGESLAEWVGKVDYAFVDGTFFADGELPDRDMSVIKHPFISETMELLADLPPKIKSRVHFIHLNHTNPALRTDSGARQLVTDNGFSLAEEGMIIQL